MIVECAADIRDQQLSKLSPLLQVLSELQDQGYRLLREHPQFQRLVVTSAPLLSATNNDNQNPASVSAAAVRAQAAQLQGLAGVSSVEINRQVFLPTPIKPQLLTGAGDSTTAAATNTQSQQGSSSISGFIGLPDGTLADTCPLVSADDPDIDTGRYSEGAPYGIQMVQADSNEAQQLSRRFQDKVLYCVIDTGLDINNREFSKESK